MSPSRSAIESTLGVSAKGKPPSFWRRRRGLLIWSGAGLIGLFIVYSMMSGGGPDAPNYRTAEIKRGALTVKVSATGKLEPVNKVDVGAEISGRVIEVLVDFGDKVTAGQIIARIDTQELQARQIEARAGVQQAEASLSDAQNALERAEELARSKNVSQAQLESARTARQRASAALATARAALQVIETNLAKADIKAPINGIVLDRQIDAGQTVAASFQTPVLFTIASDLTALRLKAEIDEADIGQVVIGQPAVFTVDAFPNRSFNARVEAVRPGPKTNRGQSGGLAGVVVYEAVLSVGNEDGLLRPGLTATAEIQVRSVENVLLVANGALRFVPEKVEREEARARANAEPGAPEERRDRSKGRVFLVEGGPEPRAVEVTIGVTDGRMTELTGGEAKEGDKAITGTQAPSMGDNGNGGPP